MDEDQAPDQGALFPKSLGDRLREAREAKGMSLADVAGTTRVPIRHLEAIEADNYDGLPSPTYAIGFTKSYARAVGLDDKTVAAELRANPQMPLPPSVGFEDYTPADPRRLPSRGLAMGLALVALALLVAVAIWYGSALFRGSGEELAVPTPDPSATIAAGPDAASPSATGGQVVLTATDTVWLSIYDATGKKLFEKTMTPGETFDVPAGADNPMINVGRPDKLTVTINGSAVAPLADGKVAIKDVPISAAALQARGGATAQPTPAPTATSGSSSSRSSDVPRAFRTSTPRPTGTPRAVPTPDPVSLPTAAPTSAP